MIKNSVAYFEIEEDVHNRKNEHYLLKLYMTLRNTWEYD